MMFCWGFVVSSFLVVLLVLLCCMVAVVASVSVSKFLVSLQDVVVWYYV